MTADIPADLRALVASRANNTCEYCRMPQAYALHKHEPDHIVPRQHGGQTDAANLALACFRCNRHKGPNVGSIDPLTGILCPFFNPREQLWTEHFVLEKGMLLPLTAEGRVTVKILKLNEPQRVAERLLLERAGVYPAQES